MEFLINLTSISVNDESVQSHETIDQTSFKRSNKTSSKVRQKPKKQATNRSVQEAAHSRDQDSRNHGLSHDEENLKKN
jgi:hypothetical protein